MFNKGLSIQSIKHGKLQVEKMLLDRPVMGKHLTEDDFIFKWIVRKFAGEDLEDTIDWDNRAPYHGAKASHLTPCQSERGRINIARGLSFETSWAGVIFELHNIAFYEQSHIIMQKAYMGELKKKEFILEMAKIELKVINKTKKFYKKIWEPWAKQKGILTDPYEWYMNCPLSFEKWIRGFGKKSDYPWKIYSDFYDKHLKEWVNAL